MHCVPSDVYNTAAGSHPGAVDRELAEKMFAAARSSVAADHVTDAIHLSAAALDLDPDHADARRLLGYQRVGEHWAGGYAKQQLDKGQVWRREYGWINAADEPQYARGLRPWGKKWINAEEDAKRHATIAHGWKVRTDHVEVTTNISREAGAELAVRLESLYQIWLQLFGELAMPARELQARLDGKQATGFLRKPFRVIYHRSREEYNDALRPRQPQIDMTLGIYFDRERESHFFAGDDQDPGTIAHEAVHQFFYESAPRPTRHLGLNANMWAIEGAACYFETLSQIKAEPNAYTIGAPDAGRIPAARHRRVVDDYYVPLAELSALGMEDLQKRPDIAPLYSQSAGLASFFMDYDGGKYRKAFRELLALIYAGRDSADTLAKLTGVDYETLDREYFDYMKSLPDAGAAIDPPAPANP